MNTPGYYRFPTIHGDTLVFVCEDDLWSVPAGGGTARRLTSGLGEVTHPRLSPDGSCVAFTGREEGQPEVYFMPALGGETRRLTFLGAMSLVAGWSRDGRAILFASNSAQPFERLFKLYSVGREGGMPDLLPTGPALGISYGLSGGVVIGRNTADPARWKRYKGGRAGDLWIDEKGTGKFRRLISLKGNLDCPVWIGDRIFFISDHEGIGNVYSCLPSGKGLKRHTRHDEYYVRNASGDSRRIVYQAGADLYVYDPGSGRNEKIHVEFHSPRTQRNRKFVDAAKYLEDYSLHPSGHSLAIVSRGKAFTLGNWEGPAFQHGEPDAVRYRLARWLKDGKRIIVVTDAGGEEVFEIHHTDGGGSKVERLPEMDIGRPVELSVCPKRDEIVFTNHKYELMFLDLKSRKLRLIDRSRHDRISGIAWSPDGLWVAYSFPNTQKTGAVKICNVKTGRTWQVTDPVLVDTAPSFDPEGKYLYFLSYRQFDPVYDNLHFDLNFPRGVRPCLITLQSETPSPFIEVPRPLGGRTGEEPKKADGKGKEKPSEKGVRIDFEGIQSRVTAFPLSRVPEGRYGRIWGIKGKVLFTHFPVEGSLEGQWFPTEPPAKASLEVYNLEDQKKETLIEKVTDFDVSQDGSTLAYRSGSKLRVVKAGERPDDKTGEPSGRKSGWINLSRVKVSVVPPREWGQMYREAWRLQRDHFWSSDMSRVDWQKVYNRYLPLVDRVATRSEFSDLMWEMQGELGTSHCYEMGGDYRPQPRYDQGFLGVDFGYDERTGKYRVAHVARGDCWDDGKDSPLNGPGINIKPGQVLVAIDGRPVGKDASPQEILVNRAGCEVCLTFSGDGGRGERTVTVKALRSEFPVLYREWVNENRSKVHKATGGRVGYVHIPDMMAPGYAEFHRSYLSEAQKEALIVDVRYNRGGHVSQLILEKLARRRIGYDVTRWGQPMPYPFDSVAGPMVAVTNELAGSDGDIFSHGFKLMKLGTLIGKRTWGGVIGIWPRHPLVDGSVTTQPEFSFWFRDVGWGVENYGTDPDIEVDIAPQDYVLGRDPQLDRAISEIKRLLKADPPKKPDFKKRPNLSLPSGVVRPHGPAAGARNRAKGAKLPYK